MDGWIDRLFPSFSFCFCFLLLCVFRRRRRLLLLLLLLVLLLLLPPQGNAGEPGRAGRRRWSGDAGVTSGGRMRGRSLYGRQQGPRACGKLDTLRSCSCTLLSQKRNRRGLLKKQEWFPPSGTSRLLAGRHHAHNCVHAAVPTALALSPGPHHKRSPPLSLTRLKQSSPPLSFRKFSE